MQRCDAQFGRIAGGLRVSCCIIEQSRSLPLLPAPLVLPRRLLRHAREILRELAACDADRPRRCRGVAAAADEPRPAARDHRADRRDVAVLDRGERIVLGAAIRRIQQYDIGRLARGQQAGIEP